MNFDKLFLEAKNKGIEDLEIYYSASNSTNVKLFKGEVDSYTVTNISGLAVKGKHNGKLGVVSTEKVSDDSIEFILNTIINTAAITETVSTLSVFPGSDKYEEVKTYYTENDAFDNEYKIQLSKDIHKLVMSYPHIDQLSHNGFSEVVRTIKIKNDKGLDLETKTNTLYYYTYAVAKKDTQIKTHGEFEIIRDLSKFDVNEFAKAVAEGAIKQLDGIIPASNNYKTIFSSKVAYQILGAMASNFSGENVRKGISKFGDKLHTRVASSIVSIVDNPLLDGGMSSSSFDDEGVATYSKNLIKDGVLNTFLYDRKTANLVGLETTGNGFKAGVNGLVSIKPTNIYFEKGNTSFDELLSQVGNGIYITSVAGLHSGLNSISGDFSLQSNGFIIENGKVSSPAELFTISGNFFELLNNIENIADDLEFDTSGAGSPSILVSSISVSGK